MNRKRRCECASLCNKLMILSLVFIFFPIPEASSNYSTGYIPGRVVDSFTRMPIKGAIVTVNNEVVLTDEKGFFQVTAVANKVGARAFGYTRAEQDVKTALVSQILSVPLQIELVPFTPKALYLSFYGIGSKILKDSALKLIEETELNALVIDVKGDRGIITYKSSIPLAEEIGAQKMTIIKDIKSFNNIAEGKRDIYHRAYRCLQRQSARFVKTGVGIKDPCRRTMARQGKSCLG